MAFFFNHLIDCWWSYIIARYRLRHLFPIVMEGSLCFANDRRPTTFIHFWKCQKNVLVHDPIDVILYSEGSISPFFFFSFNTSSIPVGRAVRHGLESIGAIKRKWFEKKERQSNHGVYGRNWYAKSFLLLFYSQTLLRLTKFFYKFHTEPLVVIMHNALFWKSWFFAKQYNPQTNCLFLNWNKMVSQNITRGAACSNLKTIGSINGEKEKSPFIITCAHDCFLFVLFLLLFFSKESREI